MQHFRAAFEPIAETVLICDSGALSTPDPQNRTYAKVRWPIHPLDPIGGAGSVATVDAHQIEWLGAAQRAPDVLDLAPPQVRLTAGA